MKNRNFKWPIHSLPPRNEKSKTFEHIEILFDDGKESLSSIIFLWKDFVPSEERFTQNLYSLPDLVESNRKELRKRYTSMAARVGTINSNGATLIEKFKLRNDFSYWWMTELSEMHHFGRNSPVFSILRLLALQDWLKKYSSKIKNIRIIGISEQECINAIKSWAKPNNINCDIRSNSSIKVSLKSYLINLAPMSVKAAGIVVIYILPRLRLKIEKFSDDSKRLSFWSYLLNEEIFEKNESRYHSQYWGDLINTLTRRNIKSIWMHFWLPNSGKNSIALSGVPSLFSKLNTNRSLFTHHLVNGRLPLCVIIKTIRDYLRVRKFFSFLYKISVHEIDGGIDFANYYLPGIKKDCRSGQAMWNCLCINLFDWLLSQIPKQRGGVFLFENTAWEVAFLHFWRVHNHGTIVGFSHTVIRYWDLRYFNDITCFEHEQLKKPRPDIIAVSRQSEIMTLIQNGYRTNEVIKVEALRYLKLNSISRIPSSKNNIKIKKILIIGDYDRNTNHILLDIVIQLKKVILANFEVLFKPHPGAESKVGTSKSTPCYETVFGSLSDYLTADTIVCASHSTSAIFEVMAAGLPLFIHRIADVLDMCPLDPIKTQHIRFHDTKSLHKLINALQHKEVSNSSDGWNLNDFNLDSSLCRWDDLLSYLNESGHE